LEDKKKRAKKIIFKDIENHAKGKEFHRSQLERTDCHNLELINEILVENAKLKERLKNVAI
tara:strand:+ start:150 stop:332 length:183 start_codon:yes stop_codon:yes gene_type:complete